jgi:DUF2975 family protein
MNNSATRTGARALEVVLLLALLFSSLFGVVRTVFGPAGFSEALPDVARNAGNSVFGSNFLGESPSVRAQLAPAVTVRTDPALYTYGADAIPEGRGEFSGPFEAQVNAYAPTAGQRFGLVGSELLASVATILVVVLLLKIVRSLRLGDPFVAANARRLRLIAVVVAVGGMGAGLLRLVGEHLVLSEPAIRPFVEPNYHLSFLPLLASAGVWLLAEVFRRGTLMRAELEGLV